MAISVVGFIGPRTGTVFYPVAGQAGDIALYITTDGAGLNFFGDSGGGTWTYAGTNAGPTGGGPSNMGASVYWKRLTGPTTTSPTTDGAGYYSLYMIRGIRPTGDPWQQFDSVYTTSVQSFFDATLPSYTGPAFYFAFAHRNAATSSTNSSTDPFTFNNIDGTPTQVNYTRQTADAVGGAAWYVDSPSTTGTPSVTYRNASGSNSNSASLLLFALTDAAATFPVSQSFATEYNVKATVETSLATSYKVRAPISKPIAASWNVRTSVAPKSVPASWNVRQSVPKSLTTTWGVVGRVATSVVSTWNVRTGVSRSVTSSWGITGGVIKSWSLDWKIVGRQTPYVFGNLTGTPNAAIDVEGFIPRQTFVSDVKFNRIDLFLGTYTAPSRSTVVTVYTDGTETVRATATTSHGDNQWVTFNLSATLPAGNYKIGVRAVGGGSNQVAWWKTNADVYPNGVAMDFNSPSGGDFLFAVNGVATSFGNRAWPNSWKVAQAVSTSFTTSWDTLNLGSAVSRSFTQSWVTKAPAGTTLSSTFNVRAQVSTTQAWTWSVADPKVIAAFGPQTWRVRAQVSASTAESWKVFVPVSTSMAGGTWRVFVPVSTSKASSYRVFQSVLATTAPTWKVYSRTAMAPQTWTWQVLNPASKTFASYDWRTRQLVTISRQLRWHVRVNETGTINITSEMSNTRVTASFAGQRVYAEIPITRVSAELAAGNRAIPVLSAE